MPLSSDSAIAHSTPAAAKHVILSFGAGSLSQVLFVTLQIGPEGKASTSEIVASLTPDAELEQCFQAWSRCYSSLAGSCPPLGIPKAEDETAPVQYTAADIVACERAGRLLGDCFNQWLRQPSLLPLREAWLEKLRPEDELRVILQTQDRVIQRLPWHQWDLLERYPKAEIALGNLGYNQAKVAIAPQAPKGIAPSQPLVKILAILGDSSGIDVQADRDLLEQLPGAEVTFLVEPRRSELTAQLWQQPWRILFFAGHGSSEGADGLSQGCFRINKQETLTLEQLKFGLKRSGEQGLQLAIFNSCDGLGLAQEFAHLDIPQLIVMREPVPDRVAQAFLKYFLSAYSGGASFYPAVRQARERLQAMEGQFPCATWLPMIVQNPVAVPLSWRSLAGQSEPTAQTESAISSQPWFKRLAQVAAASLLASVSILSVRHLGWLQPLELRAYDYFLQLRPQEPPDSRLLIIEVTEEDVQAQRDEQAQSLEQPWDSLSDTSLSKLLTLLNQHDPVAIGLDLYRDYPAQPSELSQQLEDSEHLVTICRASQTDQSGVALPPEVEVERQGFSDGVVDADQVVRRHLLAATPPADSPCGTSYAFSTQLALRYLAEQEIYLEQLANGDWLLGEATIKPMTQRQGSYQAEDLWGYQTLLNYRSHRSIDALAPRVSLGAALNGELQTELIRDRIILIGTTAAAPRDLRMTPYGTALPSVMFQAQMVSQLLSAALDGRAFLWSLPRWGDGLWIGLWSLLGSGLAGLCLGDRFKWLWLGLGGGLTVHFLLSLGLLVQVGVWLPLVPASLALLLGAGLAICLFWKLR